MRPLVRHAPAFVLAAMMLAYALTAGSMALRRHWNLESQALDMGYADQVTWNMTQGRLFRFTPFRGPIGAEVVKLQYPPLTYSRGEQLGIGVQIGTGPPSSRLVATGQILALADDDHVAILGRLP
jgi:hypothetical protein